MSNKLWSVYRVPGRLSHVQVLVTLWTVARQAPLSMGFSRQEYWNGLPCPPPGALPDPGIEPESLTSILHWQVGSLPLAPLGSPRENTEEGQRWEKEARTPKYGDFPLVG